jgi:hypothetical protein
MEAELVDPVDIWKVMDADPDLKVLESINCSTTCARRSVLIAIIVSISVDYTIWT